MKILPQLFQVQKAPYVQNRYFLITQQKQDSFEHSKDVSFKGNSEDENPYKKILQDPDLMKNFGIFAAKVYQELKLDNLPNYLSDVFSVLVAKANGETKPIKEVETVLDKTISNVIPNEQENILESNTELTPEEKAAILKQKRQANAQKAREARMQKHQAKQNTNEIELTSEEKPVKEQTENVSKKELIIPEDIQNKQFTKKLKQSFEVLGAKLNEINADKTNYEELIQICNIYLEKQGYFKKIEVQDNQCMKYSTILEKLSDDVTKNISKITNKNYNNKLTGFINKYENRPNHNPLYIPVDTASEEIKKNKPEQDTKQTNKPIFLPFRNIPEAKTEIANELATVIGNLPTKSYEQLEPIGQTMIDICDNEMIQMFIDYIKDEHNTNSSIIKKGQQIISDRINAVNIQDEIEHLKLMPENPRQAAMSISNYDGVYVNTIDNEVREKKGYMHIYPKDYEKYADIINNEIDEKYKNILTLHAMMRFIDKFCLSNKDINNGELSILEEDLIQRINQKLEAWYSLLQESLLYKKENGKSYPITREENGDIQVDFNDIPNTSFQNKYKKYFHKKSIRTLFNVDKFGNIVVGTICYSDPTQ